MFKQPDGLKGRPPWSDRLRKGWRRKEHNYS